MTMTGRYHSTFARVLAYFMIRTKGFVGFAEYLNCHTVANCQSCCWLPALPRHHTFLSCLNSSYDSEYHYRHLKDTQRSASLKITCSALFSGCQCCFSISAVQAVLINCFDWCRRYCLGDDCPFFYFGLHWNNAYSGDSTSLYTGFAMVFSTKAIRQWDHCHYFFAKLCDSNTGCRTLCSGSCSLPDDGYCYCCLSTLIDKIIIKIIIKLNIR